jgi:membrane associated rhomboid family serine protease
MTEVVETFLSGKPRPSAKLVVMGTLALMALITVLGWRLEGLREGWVASRQTVLIEGQYLRVPVSLFLHGDPAHYLSNAYMFGILGYLISGYFGPGLYFFLIFGLGTVVHVLSLFTYPLETVLIGASGVVYIFAGFWLIMFVGIDRRFSAGARWLRAIGVGLAILFPTTFEPNTSYRAHAIGMVAGLVFGGIYFAYNRVYFRKFEVLKEIEVNDGEIFDPLQR